MLKFCIDFSICLSYALESDDILAFIFRFIFHRHSLCTTYLAIKCRFLVSKGGKQSILRSIAEILNVSQMGKTEHSSHLFLLDLAGFWKGPHRFHVAECIGKLFFEVRSGVFI